MVVAVEPNPFKHSRTDPDRRVSPHPEPPESRRRSQRARGMGYTAFGSSYSPRTSVEIDQRYTYTGRETTTDPNLMYYRWRIYAPTLGRFTARDPWGYMGGINVYAYVFGNPIFWNDAFGLEGQFRIWTGQALGDPEASDVTVRYEPDEQEKKCCDNIILVQVAQTQGGGGDWTPHLDNPQQPYGNYNSPDGQGHQPWDSSAIPGSAPSQHAEIGDTPGGPSPTVQSFETIAVCISQHASWNGRFTVHDDFS